MTAPFVRPFAPLLLVALLSACTGDEPCEGDDCLPSESVDTTETDDTPTPTPADTDQPDTDTPDTDQPDTDTPDTDTPDTDTPDTDTPDTDLSDTGDTDDTDLLLDTGDTDGLVDTAPDPVDSGSGGVDSDVDTDTSTPDSTETLWDTGPGTGDTPDTIETALCPEILAWSPADGALDVPVDTVVDIEFSTLDPNANATLFLNGSTVPSSLSWNGTTMRLTPSADLMSDSSYDVLVSGSCDSGSITFATAPATQVGSPIAGSAWSLDIAGGTWVQPAGAGALLTGLLDGGLLLGVTAENTSTIDLIFAATDLSTSPVSQNMGFETFEMADVDFSTNPTFSGSLPQATLDVNGLLIVADNVDFSGTFDAISGDISQLSVAGLVDTRPLGPGLGLGTTPGATCGFLSFLGVVCEPCATGTGNFCIQVEVTDVPAPLVPGLTVVPVATTSPTATCSALPIGSVWVWAVGLLALRRRRIR